MRFITMKSPLGELVLGEEPEGLSRILLAEADYAPQPDPEWEEVERLESPVVEQLREYFEGKRKTFDLPLKPRGTEFQQHVWRVLQEIPYGQTISYRELAARVGNPKAARAVGQANGKNPLPIVVPCHRVVGARGHLTGYAGGVRFKKTLLELETTRLEC